MAYVKYTDVTQEGVPVDFTLTIDEAIMRQKTVNKDKIYKYDKDALEDFLYYNFGWIEK